MSSRRRRPRATLCVIAGLAAPLAASGAHAERGLTIRSGGLSVELRRETHQYAVTDRRTGRAWITAPLKDLAVTDAEAASSERMALKLHERSTGRAFRADVRVWNGANVTFRLEADNLRTPLGRLDYPGAMRLQRDPSELSLVFCNRSCGQLVGRRDDYPTKGFWRFGNLGLDMPWMGVIDAERGDGYMLLLETPYDAAVFLVPDERGRHWPQTAWHGEFDRIGYARRVSYRFTASGGYVAQAKAYREYLRRTAGWRSLADKARERPNVNLLRGAAITWGASMIPSAIKFAEEARDAGIRRAIINANGKFPPADMERMGSFGYLVGEYDNVTDIFDGPPGFTSDSVERYAARDRTGQPYKGWQHMDGRQMYRRATWRAVEFYPSFLEGVLRQYPFTARFLDISSTIDPPRIGARGIGNRAARSCRIGASCMPRSPVAAWLWAASAARPGAPTCSTTPRAQPADRSGGRCPSGA